jgi:hypothetical protein
MVDSTSGPVSDGEQAGIATVRSRRRWMWGFFLGGVPVCACAAVALGKHAGWVVFPWAAIWAVLVVRHWTSVCPRCGHLFNWGSLGPSYWSTKCQHCALPLAADARLASSPAPPRATK